MKKHLLIGVFVLLGTFLLSCGEGGDDDGRNNWNNDGDYSDGESDDGDSSDECEEDSDCASNEACIQGSCKSTDVGQFSLYGTVTDWRTGAGVSGVTVSLSDGVATSDTTDSSGHYQIPSIDEAEYTITFHHPSYFSRSAAISVFGANKVFDTELAPNETHSNIKLSAPDGSIQTLNRLFGGGIQLRSFGQFADSRVLTLGGYISDDISICQNGWTNNGQVFLHLPINQAHDRSYTSFSGGIELLITLSTNDHCVGYAYGSVNTLRIAAPSSSRYLIHGNLDIDNIEVRCSSSYCDGERTTTIWGIEGEFYISTYSAPDNY